MDVEDRIRKVLPRNASERLVTRQLKIFRDQWIGLGVSLDYALALSCPSVQSTQGCSDQEIAAVVWRNFLGARGAQGIDDPGAGAIRRAVNLTASEGLQKLSTSDGESKLQALQSADDRSGVHDFVGSDTDL